MGFDMFSDKKTNAVSTTTVSTDSFNRAFNSVRNTADSNNLSIAVGTDANPFLKSADDVVKFAWKVLGVVSVIASLAWLWSRYRRKK